MKVTREKSVLAWKRSVGVRPWRRGWSTKCSTGKRKNVHYRLSLPAATSEAVRNIEHEPDCGAAHRIMGRYALSAASRSLSAFYRSPTPTPERLPPANGSRAPPLGARSAPPLSDVALRLV